MLLTKKDKDGYIYALIDFDVVNTLGKKARYGKYCYIKYIYCQKDYNFEEQLRWFIRQMSIRTKLDSVEFIYWTRRNNGRKRETRLFTRKHWENKYLNRS